MYPETYDKRTVKSSDAKNFTTFYALRKFSRSGIEKFGVAANVLGVVSQARSSPEKT